MGLPHITRFCFCMNLENGSRAIGLAHLTLSTVVVVISSMFATAARSNVGTVEDAGDHLYSTWHTIFTVVAVLSVAHMLLACTLLFAVIKRNTTAMRVWVWVMLALYAAALASVLVSMTRGFSSTGSDIFVALLEGVLMFGVLAYCILCVHSHCLQLRSGQDMEGPKHDY